jgi:hypothetical protein
MMAVRVNQILLFMKLLGANVLSPWAKVYIHYFLVHSFTDGLTQPILLMDRIAMNYKHRYIIFSPGCHSQLEAWEEDGLEADEEVDEPGKTQGVPGYVSHCHPPSLVIWLHILFQFQHLPFCLVLQPSPTTNRPLHLYKN